jgi:hypothetical protein
MNPKKNWLILILFAVAMAWMESATVTYMRILLHRVEPHQPNPLPFHPDFGANLGMIEVVREVATIVMLATGGWLAGRSPRSRFGLFLVAFGVWDILYYVFLAVMGPWPKTPWDWDVLFLIPLPWWGPVWSPCSIAALMVVGGSLVALRDQPELPFWPGKAAWRWSWAGAALALAVFMADALFNLPRGWKAVRTFLPDQFLWAPFLLALVLMSVPVLDLVQRMRGPSSQLASETSS